MINITERRAVDVNFSQTDPVGRSSRLVETILRQQALAACLVRELRAIEERLTSLEERHCGDVKRSPRPADAICEHTFKFGPMVTIVHQSAAEALRRRERRSKFSTIDGRSLMLIELRLLSVALPIMVH